MTLNDARGFILLLAPTMAHINEDITIENKKAEGLKEKAKNGEITAAEIERGLMVTYMDLESAALTFPRTVCSSESCVTIHNGTRICNKFCHERCYIEGVESEVRNDVRLKNCAAMDGKDNCKECGCPWQNHLHIRVDRKLVSKQKVDDSRQAELKESAPMSKN
jgi:hypothetical protein